MEESNNKLLESERKLQEERQRAVVLEQHLEKLRLEPGRTAGPQKAAPRNKTGRDCTDTVQVIVERPVEEPVGPSTEDIANCAAINENSHLACHMSVLQLWTLRTEGPRTSLAHAVLACPLRSSKQREDGLRPPAHCPFTRS